MPEVFALIPARGGSKGLPGKNLRLLGDKPLIWYTINAALKAKTINRIAVSTDCPVISEYCQSLSVEIINRPAELASDTALINDVISHTFYYLRNEQDYNPDIIVNLNPTSPFRSNIIIDKALNKLINSNFDSIFTGIILREFNTENYGKWKVLDNDKIEAKYNYYSLKRRQDFKLEYSICENGALYAINTNTFLKVNTIIGEKPTFIHMKQEESVNIDSQDDFEYAETLFQAHFKND